MKFFVTTILLVSLSVLALSQGNNPVDTKCVEMHCKEEFTACTSDQTCMQTINCIEKCWKDWDNDTSPQKLTVQNCTNQCVFSYGNDAYVKTMACISDNKCITFPSIPSMCKGPDNVKIQKNISASEMAGDWHVLRGYNTVYDCYPCDKNSITPGNPSGTVKISFDGIGVDGTLKPVEVSGTFTDNAPKPGFNVSIVEAGALVNFTWWMFDCIEDSGNKYYLVYYCGSTNMWNYDGAMVKSKATMISEGAMTAISNSFQTSVGLDFSKFCSPKVDGCA